MNKEFLTDYDEREDGVRREFLKRLDDDFELGRDRFPPDNRFSRLKQPVVQAAGSSAGEDIWSQVPFCGSLIVPIGPFLSAREFEKRYFRISEIPRIVDFAKETGKIQISLYACALRFEGFDFLDPIFKELNPPRMHYLQLEDLTQDHRALNISDQTFRMFAKGSFLNEILHILQVDSRSTENRRLIRETLEGCQNAFAFLKLTENPIINRIEELMIDSPRGAMILLHLAKQLIMKPLLGTRCDMQNMSLDTLYLGHRYLPEYSPSKLSFPCEIGKFIVKKLTYAPLGFSSCCELLAHFDSYDLHRILKALNDGVIMNRPDIIDRNARELSEVLENIWKDPSIPRRIMGLKVGLPLAMAVMSYAAAGPAGAAGLGVLGELGYRVVDKTVATLFDSQITGLTERIAKLGMRSYQIGVYDFEKKYKGKIA